MRRNDSRFGIFGFVLATLLVLAGMMVFARYPAVFRSGDGYHAVFKSVAGLNPGDEVRYGGLLVGTVTGMKIDSANPTRIVVTFRVKPGTPVRIDTKASIAQIGMLGEPYLHLAPGGPSSPPLPPGATLASVDNATFTDAMARLAVFFDRADTLLSGVERLANAAPFERFDRTLTRIDTLVRVATAGSSHSFAAIDSSAVRMNQLAARADRLVAMLDTTIRTAGPQLSSTQEEAVRTARELRLLVADLRDAMQQEGGVNQMVRNLSVTSDNLARLSDRLERDPTSVLRRRAAPAKPSGPPVRE